MAVLDRVTRTTLEQVLRPTGPVASVYLGSPPDVSGEYQLAWETRWRPVSAALRRQGVDEATVAALAAAVAGPVSGRAAHGSGQAAAFAIEGRVRAVVGLPGLDEPDAGHFSAPARVLPMLAWAQERPAYVLVLADRTGADLEASIGAGATPVRSAVEGAHDDIARTAPAGFMTQRRRQRRVEDSWAHNAAAAAEAAASALHRAEAKVLVLTGDLRAVHLLRGRLPAWVHQEVDVRLLTGSRAADGSQRERDHAVARVVREASRKATDAVWRSFLEEGGPGGSGVAGARATLQALSEGRIGILLVRRPRPGEDRTRAWFGPLPTQLQVTDRAKPPWEGALLGPVQDVAVRSAVLTGARVEVVGEGVAGDLPDGIGGICRSRPHRSGTPV